MDLVTDFLWPLKPVVNGIYFVIAGQFIPGSCTWCRPAFWISEVVIIGFIASYMRPWTHR